jgi:hypothetical protein
LNKSKLNRAREWLLNDRPHAKRIAVIGNSFVEGASLPTGQRFTEKLESLLAERGVDAVVMNFGVGRQNIINYYDNARDIGQMLKPDITIIAIHNGSNFFHDTQTIFLSNRRIKYVSSDKGVFGPSTF